MKKINVVFFDLDGTLLDTSNDLLFAINQMRKERHLQALLLDDFKPVISHGVQAMLAFGLAITPEQPLYKSLYEEFIQRYSDNIARNTEIFPGINELIAHIEFIGMQWGIVTNKIFSLTNALLAHFKVFSRVNCVVGGGSGLRRKPHPDSLLHACNLLNCSPDNCLYVGDIENDIIAGKAAGMQTALVLYSYLPSNQDHANCGADILLNHPMDLKKYL